MADYVRRAAFYEGQIVGAADLNLVVSYDRDERARHQRLQHTWGVVTGLELTGAARTTSAASGSKPYQEVTLAPGIAVDGTGRTVVVTEPMRVPDEEFRDLGVAISDPEAWYPVFLQGRDAEISEAAALAGACASPGANRVSEIFEVTFGRIAELDALETQQAVDITDGPGGGSGTPWKVLLGFVRWDESIGKFTSVGDESEGVRRRYAGVRAGEVTGAGGRLVLRSDDGGTAGAPAVRIASGDKGALTFGAQSAAGDVTPVMTVDTDGNLTVTGRIVGALAGGVQVESGLATDGMLLPLPPGITQKQIDDGKVVIQTHVTPHIRMPAGFDPADKRFPHFYECRVEARRVKCRVRWIATAGAMPAPVDLPGVCDYVLMAFPGADGGS